MHRLWKSLLLVASLAVSGTAAQDIDEPGRACGFKIADCADDMTCVPDSPSCTDMQVCAGTCQFTNEYPSCGGHVIPSESTTCGEGSECLDDPRLPKNCGMACDRPGICVPLDAPQCSGFAGFQCPEKLFCYDLPNDGCDPDDGGNDCIGVCL